MGKLTKAQINTLAVLAATAEWRGSYPGLLLGTLNALSLRHLVDAKLERGSMLLPNTNIKWRITPAGRAALKDTDHG